MDLASALEADAGTALPGLVAKDGPVRASGTSIQVGLVPAGPASTKRVGPPPPISGYPSTANISSAVGGKCWVGVRGQGLAWQVQGLVHLTQEFTSWVQHDFKFITEEGPQNS